MLNLDTLAIPAAGALSISNSAKLSSLSSHMPTVGFLKRYKPVSLSVKVQYMTPQEQQSQKQKFSSQESSFQSQLGKLPPKVYVGYSVYKGKAALTVEPHAPEFASLDSGAFKLSKEGFVLLQFAPSVGVRQYDWSRKQVFSLSVTEIGAIISLGAKGSCEFFHDPFKGKNDEGKVRKVLKVEPLPDGSGHFFNLSVQNKLMNLDESIYIPITKAEFTVLVSSFNFIVPYLLGWHTVANTIKPEDGNRGNNADFEWTR